MLGRHRLLGGLLVSRLVVLSRLLVSLWALGSGPVLGALRALRALRRLSSRPMSGHSGVLSGLLMTGSFRVFGSLLTAQQMLSCLAGFLRGRCRLGSLGCWLGVRSGFGRCGHIGGQCSGSVQLVFL